jgi:hypothetical protein
MRAKKLPKSIAKETDRSYRRIVGGETHEAWVRMSRE